MTEPTTSASLHAAAPFRSAYRIFIPVSLRWSDNDQYGHVNNVMYYSYFDSALNQLLIESTVLVAGESAIGLVAQSHCDFHRAMSYPGVVEIGIRVEKIGRSSVRYDLAAFAKDHSVAAAYGYVVHVYVDANTRRPTELSIAMREFLATLV